MATLLLAGCRQDMHDQPKFIPQRGTTFFADGRSARYQVTGTVARSQGDENGYFTTGMTNGAEGQNLPFAVTPEILERGQERFNIYCAPCHSRVGDGHGMIVQRGYYQAADFHSERMRQAPLGHFFNVITNGYGAMPNYHAELAPADRWAVVAYIRALQLSQHASAGDAPTGSQFRSLADTATAEGLSPSIVEDHPAMTAPVPAPAVPAAVPAAQPAATGSNAGSATTATAPAATQSATKQPSPAGTTQVASAEPQKAPLAAAAAAAPAAAAGDAAAGKQIYTDNCMMCHQPTRAGMPPMIPSLVDIVTRTSASHVRQTVTTGVPTGKPPMPSFASKLSSTDIDNLIAYLRTKP